MSQHSFAQILKISALTGAALVALATGAEAGRGGRHGGGHHGGGHHGGGHSVSNPPRPVTMRPEDLKGSRPVNVVVRDHRTPSYPGRPPRGYDAGNAPGGVIVTSTPRGGYEPRPQVRDHRTPVVVRDHRTPPVVRDHRGEQPVYATSGRSWGTYVGRGRNPQRQPRIRDHRDDR